MKHKRHNKLTRQKKYSWLVINMLTENMMVNLLLTLVRTKHKTKYQSY